MRPCPFCGEAERLAANHAGAVECGCCGAIGPTPNDPHDTGEELWSHREPWDLPIIYVVAAVMFASAATFWVQL